MESLELNINDDSHETILNKCDININDKQENNNTNYDYDVFVFCGGKCGGATLTKTLSDSEYKVCHLHDSKTKGIIDSDIDTKNVFNIIDEISKTKTVYIIDVYRNPIERKISAFFQNIDIELPNYKNYTVDELINYFNLNCLLDLENYHPIDEVLEHYKLPLFNSFDFKKRYNIIEHENKKIIKILFNDLPKWENILSNIFSHLGKKIKLVNDNLTRNKSDICDLFQCFKKKYEIPKDYIYLIKKNNEFKIYNKKINQKKYIKKLLRKAYECKYENLPEDFVPKDYIELNNDLKNMSEVEAKFHYECYGYKECRKYKYENIPENFVPEDFVSKVYIELNDDLKHMKEEEAMFHYKCYGYKEGRKYKYEIIPEDFFPKVYIELNDDLKHMTEEEAMFHYKCYGYKEGRKYKTSTI